MKKWKILNETDISPSRWFPLTQHKVELPNGVIVDDYFIGSLKNVGMVLPITTTKEIVLVKQYKHGINEVVIELPAGFQQEGKSIQESALAELEEEVGIKTEIDNLISLGKICNIPTKMNQTTFGYLASGLTFNSVQNLEMTEEIEIMKYSPLETIEMVKKGEIWVGDSVGFLMRAYLSFPKLFTRLPAIRPKRHLNR